MRTLKNHGKWLKIMDKKEFWIKNISKTDVSLGDLALIVPHERNMNLLDSKHFSYTLEQLEKSAASGSLFRKRDKIKIRKVAPEIIVKPGIYISNEPRGTIPRSLVVIEEKRYEELEISDEKFAEEFAAIDEDTFKDKSGQ
jgi:hypothetical protein